MAEPNYFVYAHNTQPNDSYFSRQLSLHNTGQGAGLAGVDIDAPEAWDIQNGGAVVVAVLDTGIDIKHPDLEKNIWVNTDEIDGNGIDDDQNGFIDDYQGWNFISSENFAGDDSGHGTHVAGIIGATTNNKEGVAGINWHARLMSVKTLDSNGIGSIYTAVRALSYAVDNGAMVSNLSWGTDSYSNALFEAIQQAGEQRHLVVASAGNEARSIDDIAVYPAAYDLYNLISVAASNERGQLASFSNFSPAGLIQIAAPGVGIFSTYLRDEQQGDQPIGYTLMSGTSAAAAHVSGVVSLILTQDRLPDPWQVKQTIFNTADKNSVFATKVAAGGTLNAYGVLNHYVDSILTTDNPVEEDNLPDNNDDANDAQDTNPPNTALPDEATEQDSVAPIEEEPIVTEIVLDDVILSPSTLEIAVGDQFQLMVEGGTGSLSWESSDLSIGFVDDAGMFTAKKEGETEVVAWDENGVQSNAVTILVTALSLSPAELATLTVGESLKVSLSGGVGPFDWLISSNGSPASLSVDINDSRVAIVDALQPGSFQIKVTDTASTSVLFLSSSPIQVIATNVSIVVPDSTTVLVGETLDLSVSSTSPNISWTTSDSNIAVIDEITGVVSATSKGTVTIIARDEFGQSDSFVLNVNVLPIKIAPPVNDTIWVGNNNQLQLSASGGLAPYTWQSATPWIASVDSNGLVSAVDFPVLQLADASRKSTILVSDASGNSTTVDITVNKAYVSSPLSALAINQTVILETFIAGSIQSLSVSGTGGVYVDQTLASVRGERAGDVVVSIVDGLGNTATTQTISVNTLPLVIGEPSTRDLWIGNGETISLSAEDGQGPYLWSSDTIDIASVDKDSGLVTGISEGTAVIRVTDDLGNSNAITLSVKKLTIDPVSSAIYAYDKLQLSADGYGALNWSVDNDAIANIGQFGLLSAMSAGSVTVNVTDALLNSASMTITVLPLQALSMEDVVQPLWIGNGNTVQLSVVGGKPAYSWSSDTPSLAVVDSKGLVTAVSTGNAQIRVTDSIGNFTTMSISIKQISLSAPSTSIEAYTPLQFTGFGSGSLTWSVSGVGASVSQGGLLSTTASGNVTVTVTDMLNNSASVLITVTQLVQLTV
ncbi:MAG: S8 family serine peptidase, partial [Gammaproteobacteria bacterium]|nr:S8 family serine peptidase [Gammaproteobacteria bacterium]